MSQHSQTPHLPRPGSTEDEYALWWTRMGSTHIPANGGSVVCLGETWWFSASPEVHAKLRRHGVRFPLAVKLGEIFWNRTPGTFPVLGAFRRPKTGMHAISSLPGDESGHLTRAWQARDGEVGGVEIGRSFGGGGRGGGGRGGGGGFRGGRGGGLRRGGGFRGGGGAWAGPWWPGYGWPYPGPYELNPEDDDREDDPRNLVGERDLDTSSGRRTDSVGLEEYGDERVLPFPPPSLRERIRIGSLSLGDHVDGWEVTRLRTERDVSQCSETPGSWGSDACAVALGGKVLQISFAPSAGSDARGRSTGRVAGATRDVQVRLTR